MIGPSLIMESQISMMNKIFNWSVLCVSNHLFIERIKVEDLVVGMIEVECLAFDAEETRSSLNTIVR